MRVGEQPIDWDPAKRELRKPNLAKIESLSGKAVSAEAYFNSAR